MDNVAVDAQYEMSCINEAVSLYVGEIQIEQTGITLIGHGSISLEWLPRPRLSFSASFANDPQLLTLTLGKAGIRYSHSPVSFDALLWSISPSIGGTDATIKVSGGLNFVCGGTGTELSRCVFHVPNFTDYLGRPIYVSNRHFYRGQAVMECDEWRITLQRVLPANGKFYEALSSSGGYAFTHVGEIQKRDGTFFEVKNIRDLLGILRWWLSFCRGFWVGPLLPVGMGLDGQRRWWDWQDCTIDPMQTIMTWANPYSEAFLEEAFPGFIRRMKSGIWEEPTRLAIWWYLASNTKAGGMEGSLILTQAAFELLAWTLLVEDRQMSQSKFSELTASEKLRLLLSEASIPLSIPTCLESLCSLAQRNKWEDGPMVVTQFRNGLVHPSKRKRRLVLDAGSLALFEAWSLGQWYLELLLLWLFGFNGQYINRLRRVIPRSDAIEPVPWNVSKIA